MAQPPESHYDQRYFDWQAPIGEFGGWANLTKFAAHVSCDSRVLDFGCGGGDLLHNLECRRRIGVEPNPVAAAAAAKRGIEVFASAAAVPDGSVDVIVSNNALEHTRRPFDELLELRKKLAAGGKIVFVVPCEAISRRYRPGDVNRHLYSWSPMAIGNLFSEAGFSVLESRPYIHKWPPGYRLLARLGGRRLFEAACRLYGRIERSWFQVRVIAEKGADAS